MKPKHYWVPVVLLIVWTTACVLVLASIYRKPAALTLDLREPGIGDSSAGPVFQYISDSCGNQHPFTLQIQSKAGLLRHTFYPTNPTVCEPLVLQLIGEEKVMLNDTIATRRELEDDLRVFSEAAELVDSVPVLLFSGVHQDWTLTSFAEVLRELEQHDFHVVIPTP